MKLVNELGYVDLFVIIFVHLLEKVTNDIVETVSHFLLLLVAHYLTSNWNYPLTFHFLACEFQHIRNQFLLVNDPVTILVNLHELALQVLLNLLYVAFSFDGIRAVNIDIVNVCGSHIWILGRTSTTHSAASPAKRAPGPTVWTLSTGSSAAEHRLQGAPSQGTLR